MFIRSSTLLQHVSIVAGQNLAPHLHGPRWLKVLLSIHQSMLHPSMHASVSPSVYRSVEQFPLFACALRTIAHRRLKCICRCFFFHYRTVMYRLHVPSYSDLWPLTCSKLMASFFNGWVHHFLSITTSSSSSRCGGFSMSFLVAFTAIRRVF